MSPDWSAKEEPVPYARLDDPQSLNLYAYVRNNPTTGFDRDGHCADKDALCQGFNAGFDALHQVANSAAVGQLQHSLAVMSARLQNAEMAAEKNAQSNMAGYAKNSPSLPPGVSPASMRLERNNCTAGNHDCTYTLSGMGKSSMGEDNQFSVWEHQTSGILGGQQVAPNDFITPPHGDSPQVNGFSDQLGGSALDSYRFFTISRGSMPYRSDQQIPIVIQYAGKDYAYEHLWSDGGAVSINGQTPK